MLEYSAGKYSSSQQSIPSQTGETSESWVVLCPRRRKWRGSTRPNMDKMLEVAFDGPVHRSSVNRDLAAAAGQRTGRDARRAVHITECYVMAGLVAVTKPSKKRRMMMMMMTVVLLLLQSVAWPAKRRISNFALDRLVSHYKKTPILQSPSSRPGRPCLLHLSLYSTSQPHLISSRVSSLVDAHSSAATVLQAQPPPSASLKWRSSSIAA